jgi:recombination protein RecR
MNPIDHLTEQFAKLPGIGARQARRIVYYLLRRNSGANQDLAEGIKRLGDKIKTCSESYQLFYSDDANQTLSPISRDTTRDRATLMIVEKDTDIENIEKSGAYHGLYFVLGGLIPVANSKYQNTVRTAELLKRIETGVANDQLREIIFGLSLNPESENTRVTLTREIGPLQQEHNLTVSRLGRGLSTGTELEYSDRDTLTSALETRTS